jgi:hypothetical protein
MPSEPKRTLPSAGDGSQQPLLGSAPTVRTSRWAGFSITGPRVATVLSLLLLVVLGCLLPYLTMPYITHSSEPAQLHANLFSAVNFIGGLDPVWLPGYVPGPSVAQIDVAGNVLNLGLGLQQIGLVVAILTCAALFQNEINKFFWWPLHLSGWMLALSPIPTFIGLRMLHAAGVSITLQVGWIPLFGAGVLVLVSTFRDHGRIDTYASI